MFWPRLAPQPFRLAEYGSSRGLRHHSLGRHGGREDPTTGRGQGVPPCPRLPSLWGKFPGPTLGYLAPRGPAPSLPSRSPCAPTRVTLAPPLPTCVLALPRAPASSQASNPGAARRLGRVAGCGGSGPGDIISCLGFRNDRFVIYPYLGSPRAHASPALPEEVKSRWQRRDVREP